MHKKTVHIHLYPVLGTGLEVPHRPLTLRDRDRFAEEVDTIRQYSNSATQQDLELLIERSLTALKSAVLGGKDARRIRLTAHPRNFAAGNAAESSGCCIQSQ